jgi:Zn-dependent hydrolases, including glyoxylases
VYHQPTGPSTKEFHDARAALAACPVSAIRTSSPAASTVGMDLLTPKEEEEQEDEGGLQFLSRSSYAMNTKVNGLPLPFPRQFLSDNSNKKNPRCSVWLVGHHSEKSFGAMPYLVKGKHGGEIVSVMVDVPKFSKSATRAIESLLSLDRHPAGTSTHKMTKKEPDYMFLTHVDDTAQHNEWKEYFPNVKRIFHASDLGEHNWIGDESLEKVEVLLRDESNVMEKEMLAFSLDGKGPIKIDCNKNNKTNDSDCQQVGKSFANVFKDFDSDFMILHTPGHSPGSISLLCKFSGNGGSDDDDDDNDGGGGGILFTGDTFAYSTRGRGQMTGFPRYGNDLLMQSKTLECFEEFSSQYDCIAPGHGHPRYYTQKKQQENDEDKEILQKWKHSDLHDAISELLAYKNRA